MEERNKTLIAIILGIIILIPFICSLFNSQKELNKSKLEGKLLQEGKIVTAKEVTESFVESLINEDKSAIKQYLSNECEFYSNNEKVGSIYKCFDMLQEHSTHRMESRANSVKDEETYRIYWNGWSYEENSQIIDLFMKKNVKKNEIVYEIYMIKFTDNTI